MAAVLHDAGPDGEVVLASDDGIGDAPVGRITARVAAF
jgi:hypothetical protein